MDRGTILNIINAIEEAFLILILIKIILNYVLDPFHPIRRAVDSVIEPLLRPIRRAIPPIGRFDFSPFILMISIELIAYILRSVLI